MRVDSLIHGNSERLGNYSLHWRPAQSNWNITMAAGKTGVSRTVAFLLSKADLLEWSGWKSEAREFFRLSAREI